MAEDVLADETNTHLEDAKDVRELMQMIADMTDFTISIEREFDGYNEYRIDGIVKPKHRKRMEKYGVICNIHGYWIKNMILKDQYNYNIAALRNPDNKELWNYAQILKQITPEQRMSSLTEYTKKLNIITTWVKKQGYSPIWWFYCGVIEKCSHDSKKKCYVLCDECESKANLLFKNIFSIFGMLEIDVAFYEPGEEYNFYGDTE